MVLGLPLLVIVIFLVIWIVSNVLRAQQDAAQAAARRTVNRPVGASPPLMGEKGGSDIDRFLQEIDRLRRKGQQDKSTGEPKPAQSPAKGGPGSVAEQQRRREQAPPPKPQPERKKPPVAEKKPAPPYRSGAVSAPSAPAAPPAPPSPAAPEPVSQPYVPRMDTKISEVLSPIRISAPTRPDRPMQAGAAMAPALQLLQSVFKSSQGTAVGVLLHEIFGQPKCRLPQVAFRPAPDEKH